MVKYSPEELDFRVASPGIGRELHLDLRKNTVSYKEYELNIWGKMLNLHTFNGVDKNNIDKRTNWWITYVWRFAMDGIAIALIFLCISSWIMWYKIRKDYKWSAIILIAGFLTSFYFVFMIRVSWVPVVQRCNTPRIYHNAQSAFFRGKTIQLPIV